jgi:hypothetical protein
MKRYFSREDGSSNSRDLIPQGEASNVENKRARIELDMDDIVVDPGLRMPIEAFDPNIRDEAKRAYLTMDPCQPTRHNFPKKLQSGQMRSFIKTWYKRFDWLEYSVEKDAGFCFYCYLFQPPRIRNYGNDTFTKIGFINWIMD